ncbi:rRNA-processing protein utp23 [Galdieria sulphuraria]|nr:rRNA-processing protein utp23 [Galdieria sulphuraria]
MPRSKEKKRALRRIYQYQKHFGFQEPFEILMDGTFLYQTLFRKLVIKELVQSIFGKRQVKCLVTNCIRSELKALGESHRGAALLAKRLQVLPCQHESQQPMNTDASKCIESIIRQKKKIFVATCDKRLIHFCRKQNHIPVLYITSRNTLHLEKPVPSQASTEGD